MSSFAQTHNHDHDEDGGHADHVENGTHVRTNRKAVRFVT
jgi:hypothetical protein